MTLFACYAWNKSYNHHKKTQTVDTKPAIEGPSFSQSENLQWNIFFSLFTLKGINDETKLK